MRARDSSSSQAFPDAVDEEEEERGEAGEAGFLDVGFVGFVKVLEPVGKRRRFCRVFLVGSIRTSPIIPRTSFFAQKVDRGRRC